MAAKERREHKNGKCRLRVLGVPSRQVIRHSTGIFGRGEGLRVPLFQGVAALRPPAPRIVAWLCQVLRHVLSNSGAWFTARWKRILSERTSFGTWFAARWKKIPARGQDLEDGSQPHGRKFPRGDKNSFQDGGHCFIFWFFHQPDDLTVRWHVDC